MTRRSLQSGALLIEVLVAIVICAFGLLGFAAMQARAGASEFESYQRSQALMLVQDMVDRINANRSNASSYVTAGLVGSGSNQDCTGLTGAAFDLCDWSNMLRGASVSQQGRQVGAMLSARGQVTRTTDATGTTTSNGFLVCVVWQGTVATGAPASTCGSGDPLYPDDKLRRVVESSICIGQLTNTTSPTPRC